MADFTTMTFANSSQLTSAKMTQLFDNTVYNKERTSFLTTINCAQIVAGSGDNFRIPLDDVIIDTGSKFSVASNGYQIPRDGIYSFSAKLSWNPDVDLPEEGHVDTILVVNNVAETSHIIYQVSSNAISNIRALGSAKRGPSSHFTSLYQASSGDMISFAVQRYKGSHIIANGETSTYLMGHRIDE